MSLPEPVSPWNSQPELENGAGRSATILVNDVTLREGEQSEGVSFSQETKVELALALEKAGVRQMQIGYPGRFPRDGEATQAVSQALATAQVEVVALAFVPDWEQEVDACLESGANVVSVVYRSSDRLQKLLRVTRAEALQRTEQAVARAAKGNVTVAFIPSDSTRADPNHLVQLWQKAAAAGARRVYVADSMGAATPQLITRLVEQARSLTSLPVGVHCHNDFGLVVANTLAGVNAGAQVVDVAVNGLGDRAGNAPLEEVVAALALLYGIDTGVDLQSLTDLSRLFAETSGRPLHPNKPISGPSVFVHTLPTHIQAIERDSRSIQPFEPELVGNQQRIEPRIDA
jgi:isopropylmalate/homocitrate/citramalate synthase